MLDIDVSYREQITLVAASGRIDSMNAGQFGQSLSQAIDDTHIQIVLDLSSVDYMSSAGLREIVSSLKQVKRLRGDLRIAQPSERVQEIFEMAGLDTIFQIFSTQDEAIDSFAV